MLVPEDVVSFESGDLAYTVGFERGEVSVDANAPTMMTIRVTHIYRRIDGEWYLVHRHADFHPPTSAPEIRAPPDQAALDVCSWGTSGRTSSRRRLPSLTPKRTLVRPLQQLGMSFGTLSTRAIDRRVVRLVGTEGESLRDKSLCERTVPNDEG
jgi:hypothetical protein